MEIRSFKKTFDAQLQIYVKKKIREAQKIASRPRTQQILAYIDDAVFAAGKRLRPYLIYTSYVLYGGKATQEVMHFSQSAELIHTMALIHDDIIDKGEMRHGKPCFYKFASDIFPSAPNKDHLGISQALLAGDLIFARAYEVIHAQYKLPVANLTAAQKHMHIMIQEVVAGQMIDVDNMNGDHVDLVKLEAKNHYKSGQYSFTRPLVTGALLAGAPAKSIKALEKIGELLGKAYQMRDDILDVTFVEGGDTAYYDNKTKFSDIQDGQQTYLTNYIYEKGSYAHRLAVSRAMGKRLSHEQIKELRDVFIASGAVEYGKDLLFGYLEASKKLIEKLVVVKNDYKKHLYEIIGMLETL